MSIILSKKLEDEVLKDNFPSSFSIEPEEAKKCFFFLCKVYLFRGVIWNIIKKVFVKNKTF